MSTQTALQAYSGALVGIGKGTEELDLNISKYEEVLNDLLDGIENTFSQLRSRFPEAIENKLIIQQHIAALERQLIEKNCSNLVDAEAAQLKAKEEAAKPKISPGDMRNCRELFRKIANLTHEDKLRARNVSEEDIAYLKSIFEEAKKMKDAGDAYGLEFIYTSLVAKNANISRESIVKAKKAKIDSLRRQRYNIESSFEGRLHRVFHADENKGEVMYLSHVKAELETLKTRLMRLHVLNNAQNSPGTEK